MHGRDDLAEAVALGKLLDDFTDARQRHGLLRGAHRQGWTQTVLLLLRLLFANVACRAEQRNGILASVMARVGLESVRSLPENCKTRRALHIRCSRPLRMKPFAKMLAL